MNRSKKASAQTPEARARENQTKFIHEAVHKVEKNYATLCGQMGAVNRRNGRLRDKFDEMAKSLINYANTEPGPLKVSLTQFAEHVSAIQDYRQALMDRMDGKVIQPLSQYQTACKHTKTDLNATMRSRGREVKQTKQLETIRNRAPSDRQQITRAETELQRATIDVERSTKSLEETIDKFETQRVNDVKKFLMDFVQIEMLFHAKALERYTLCIQDLQNLNVDDHLALFRNSLRPSPVQQRLDMVRQTAGLDLSDQGPGGDVYAVPQKRAQTPSSLLHTTTISQPGGKGGSRDWEDGTHDDYEDEEEYSEEEESEYDEEEEEGYEDSPESTQRHQQRLKPW